MEEDHKTLAERVTGASSMELSDLINLKRVKIVRETPNFCRFRYGRDTYSITNSDESRFTIGKASVSSMEPGLVQRMEQRLEGEIIVDENAPQEFKEVVIFHELREMQYKEARFEDAHNRAINDEILYITKFFSKEKQDAYLEFSNSYRGKKIDRRKIKREKVKFSLEQLKQDPDLYQDGNWKISNQELRRILKDGFGTNASIVLIHKYRGAPYVNGWVHWSPDEKQYLRDLYHSVYSDANYWRRRGNKFILDYTKIVEELNQKFHRKRTIGAIKSVLDSFSYDKWLKNYYLKKQQWHDEPRQLIQRT